MVVYLVGAGPGDPALITVRGLELIKEADVLIYDRLVSDELVRKTPARCERIYAGKGDVEKTSNEVQDEIHELLVDRGRRHRVVVRLKGGDPLVFGRGGEEAEVLRRAGIPFEIVPGISSVTAAAALAGMPFSHRAVTSAFAVLTGHDAGVGAKPIDYRQLPENLFILMGAEKLSAIAQRLLDAGRAPGTPVAIVRNVSLADQAPTVTTLAKAAAAQVDATPPSVIVVGEVVHLRGVLDWLEVKRDVLRGRIVALTRAEGHQEATRVLLETWGAVVVEAPLIRIVQMDVRLPDPAGFDVAVFTSLEGVKRVGEQSALAQYLMDYLKGKRVFAIGPTTQEALLDRGIEATIPGDFSSAGLAAHILESLPPRSRIVTFRSSEASPELRQIIGDRHDLQEIPVYHVEQVPPDVEKLRKAEIIFLFSSTAAKAIMTAKGPMGLESKLLVAIGGTTASGLGPGLKVVSSAVHTDEGMVAALVEHLWRQHQPPPFPPEHPVPTPSNDEA